MTSTDKHYFADAATRYLRELTGNILPFWLEHGIDPVHGGIHTALDRDGSLLDSDKSVWFQGRAAWTFAYAYNHIERRAEWLEAARSCIGFLERHCFDADGRMFYQVTTEGRPVRKRRYVFSEMFAAIAFAEWALATGDRAYVVRAEQVFALAVRYLDTPGLLESKYLEGFTAIGHSPCMMQINTAYQIRQAIDTPWLTERIDRSIAEIRNYFMKPEFSTLLETVGPRGEFIDSIPGRLINPGHCMETGWFILEEAARRDWDRGLVETGLAIIDWAWEWGWDKQYGGIFYFRDCRNRPVQEYWHDMKFWWPQNETALALLYAYLATGDAKYIERHRMVDEYQFSRLKDPDCPEWFGYLHRDGSVSQPAKGNMYKGPFHIPRMLIKSHLLCNQIVKER